MSTSICQRCDEILTSYIGTVSAGNRCNQCTQYAYGSDEPAYLYLITNVQLNKHRIGIGLAGAENSKLEQLLNDGYIPAGIWHHSDKKKTYEWESKVFKKIAATLNEDKDKPVAMGPWTRDWSEYILVSAISADQIVKIISEVVKS
jgi:hypothetical protein